jgi:uncharacterized coiled-coil protein SlyX
MSRQLLSYHLTRLDEQGLIEQVGSVNVDAPKEAHVYRVTVDGQKIAADAHARENVANEIRELKEVVDRQQNQINTLWERFEEMQHGSDL